MWYTRPDLILFCQNNFFNEYIHAFNKYPFLDTNSVQPIKISRDEYQKYFNKNDKLGEYWYSKNRGKYNHLLKLRDTKSITKLFHFIWIGPNKIPETYISYIESWIDKHPDWLFCFWNDSNIPNIINSYEYNNSIKYAQKADILRYELLYIFGGVYVDCDFLCFKNIY
jgi:mannosyltransferase OCH1-like enzyme